MFQKQGGYFPRGQVKWYAQEQPAHLSESHSPSWRWDLQEAPWPVGCSGCCAPGQMNTARPLCPSLVQPRVEPAIALSSQHHDFTTAHELGRQPQASLRNRWRCSENFPVRSNVKSSSHGQQKASGFQALLISKHFVENTEKIANCLTYSKVLTKIITPMYVSMWPLINQ